MPTNTPCILRIAIATPLRRCFDYKLNKEQNPEDIKPGMRIRVPFGKSRETIGIVISIENKSDVPPEKLKTILTVLDKEPLISEQDLSLLLWASRYYQHSAGDVIFNALPTLLRQGKEAVWPEKQFYKIAGNIESDDILKRAAKQLTLYKKLQSEQTPVSHDNAKHLAEYSAHSIKGLIDKDLVIKFSQPTKQSTSTPASKPDLPESTADQETAIRLIHEQLNTFSCFLLNGVTGSGKTQVYMQAISKAVNEGKQALVLLPEIGLTPQFIQRFESAFDCEIGLYHSGMTDQERLATWMKARDQNVSIILGTRSAVWLKLKNPGIIIVDEEHDPSYKQQEGFRYSARDIAIIRAQRENIPVVLGSATPSMESLRNVARDQYQELKLTKQASQLQLPETSLIDLKSQLMSGAFSHSLLDAIRQTLAKKQQVLLFINRRGFSPAVLCHACGHVAHCNRCDKAMTYHKQKKIIWCHHCDRQLSIDSQCPECETQNWIEVGHGTERLEEDIKTHFPEASIVRIDRDSTQNKGRLHDLLETIQSGKAEILIGTQMLAKGHHFPKLGLVGILDIDGGLYSTDFRASERMAQLITQVSGRAGRSEQRGKVLIQTHHPDHPLLNSLINDGYNAFARCLLEERAECQLPPYVYMGLLRAECHDQNALRRFLTEAKAALVTAQGKLQVYGPIDSLMPRKAGRHRMQLLIQSDNRSVLSSQLSNWLEVLEKLPISRKVRWSIDVDPQDMM